VTSTNNSLASQTASATDVVLAPDVTITKTADATPINSTDTAAYTIVVQNAATAGTGTAYNVNLSDVLPDPDHLSWTTTTAGASITSGGTLTDAIGNLLAGQSVTIHVSAVTPSGYSNTLANTASASASASNEPTIAPSTASITVLAPDLTITKTGTGTVNSTDAIGFTITVSNTGAGTAYGVNLSDPLPGAAHLSWTIQGGDPGSISGGTLSDAIGSLAPGASVTIQVSASTAAGYSATLPNTATVTSTNNSLASQTASATDVVLAPNLTITKTTTTPLVNSPGAINFTITVSNAGPGSAYNTSISDPLPAPAGVNWTSVTISGPAGTPLATLSSTFAVF